MVLSQLIQIIPYMVSQWSSAMVFTSTTTIWFQYTRNPTTSVSLLHVITSSAGNPIINLPFVHGLYHPSIVTWEIVLLLGFTAFFNFDPYPYIVSYQTINYHQNIYYINSFITMALAFFDISNVLLLLWILYQYIDIFYHGVPSIAMEAFDGNINSKKI